MNKIPVGETLRLSYAFTFGEIGTIIGLTWIAAVFQAVAEFFALRFYYPAVADALDAGGLPTGLAAALPFAMLLVSSIVFAIVGVALTRQALGLREGPAFAHIAFGPSEMKVLGSYLAVYVLVILMLSAALMLGSAVAALGPAAGLPLFLLGCGLISALVFAVVRLTYLVAPAVLDGADIPPLRSWQLSRGNFWRIVVIGLGSLLPIFIAIDIVSGIVLSPDMPAAAAPTTAAALAHFYAATLRGMLSQLPKLVGVGLVFSPLTYSMIFVPAAFAYRALVGGRAVREAEKAG